MHSSSTSYVHLTIYGGNFSPSEVSDLLKLRPTRIGKKGEKGMYTVLKECFWEYALPETDIFGGLDTSVKDLVNLFKENLSTIRNYLKKNSLRIKIFVVIKVRDSEDHGVRFSEESLSFFQKLGASIEVCCYNSD